MTWWLDPSICFGTGTTETGWTFGAPISLPLLLVAALYLRGTLNLRRRSKQTSRFPHMAAFALGWTMLAVALITPLHGLGQRLFTAHMIEHELLMAVAAPLLVLSRPTADLLWGLPSGWRKSLAQAGHFRAVRIPWRFLSLPPVATILHGFAIWLWHVPPFFEAALQGGFLHYLQHASFLGTGLLFWWAIAPFRSHRSQGTSVLHLFVTSLHTTLLGALLFVSPHLWFPSNAASSSAWGLTPLEDQQLAGLVMWVPAGLIYGGAALLLAALWIGTCHPRNKTDAYRPA